MKKYLMFILMFICIFFSCSRVKAYTVTNINRNECSNYELVTVSSNSITHIECYDTYNAALTAMNETGIENGVPSIIYRNTYIDSKYALVNLRTKSSANFNTYLYPSETSNSQASYINGYYASDAALISLYYTGNNATTRAKIALSGLKQFVVKEESGNIAYEIVPLTLVKSANKYVVSDGSIVHKIAYQIGNNNSYSSSYALGPTPDYLKENTDYYSYDGIYFYTSLYNLIDDYKAGTYENAVNKDNPYYNYYQYLPQRSKTNITSAELDTYLRGEGKTLTNSKLYGQGHYFITSQNIYGINALVSYGISLNESAKGSSNIAFTKNNVFGHAAYDYDPSGSSTAYSSVMYSIYYHADVYMSRGYAYTGDWRYYGSYLGNKLAGVNVKYASDPYWGEKATAYYYKIDKKYGLKDYNYYTIGIKNTNSAVNMRTEANTSSKVVYTIPKDKYPTFIIVGEVEGEEFQGSKVWYRVLFDSALNNNTPYKTGLYDFNKYVYIHSTTLNKINNPTSYKNPNDVVTKDTGINYKKAETEEYYEVSVDTNMYYDPTFTVNTYQTIKAGSKVLLIEKAYTDKGDIAYLVNYSDKTEWIKSSDLKYDNEYNKLIASIKYKTLEQPILLKLKSDTTIYSDSVLINSLSLTQKKDTYVIATKLAYTDEKSYSYQITYDVSAGSTGYIDASKVEQVYNYKIGNNQNNNSLNIRSEAKSSSYKVGQMSLQYTNFVILEEVTGESINGNTKWYKIIYNSPNNLTGYISSAYASATTLTNPENNEENNGENKPEDKPSEEKPKEEEIKPEEKPIEPEEEKVIYTKTTGVFNLQKLVYDADTKKFNMIATLKVDGVELSTDYNVKYALVLKDLTGKKKDKVIELNEHNYSNININSAFDLTNIEQGDYALYVRARVKTYETEVLLNNVFGVDIVNKLTIDKRGYLFRVNYYSNYVPIELSIRDAGNITTLNNPTSDNMFNDYVDIGFKNNNLIIKGTSYNVNGNYSNSINIERQIILENTTTFARKIYDVGYIDNGNYEITLRVPDNLSKKRAWFDAKLDISSLEKGTYVIYIKTKTDKIDDHGELTDIFFRELSTKTTTLPNGNKAKLYLNENIRMRIELVIE